MKNALIAERVLEILSSKFAVSSLFVVGIGQNRILDTKEMYKDVPRYLQTGQSNIR